MASQEHEEISADETLDESGSRVYELGFHLDPELPTEEVKKAYGEMRDLIAGKGAIVAEGEPIQLQLAYTISRQQTSGRRDFNSAHFAWIVYETSAVNHTEILAVTITDKRIIRFIDLVTTKDAARHSQELREMAMKMPEKAEDETVAGAELDAAIESALPAQAGAV